MLWPHKVHKCIVAELVLHLRKIGHMNLLKCSSGLEQIVCKVAFEARTPGSCLWSHFERQIGMWPDSSATGHSAFAKRGIFRLVAPLRTMPIHVRLLSGRTASVDCNQNNFVYDLRRTAEKELGVGIASLSSRSKAPWRLDCFLGLEISL